ncbi:coiled-coil domain-containing protein 69 [Osmerus eperlanus]|uniref:coiled-coil domain-containing protein 69 n=1 Tax=Osmerus eperlanus TaxID=29151 RepID=UPI002E0D9B7D
MGCYHSKKKTKVKRGETGLKEAESHQNGGKVPLEESGTDMEKQLEGNEWQLKILTEVQAASGNQERAELLKGYSLGEFCALVQNISDKVKTETVTELNIHHDEKFKKASEEHQKEVEELRRIHCEEKTLLTETYQATENVLKAKIEVLTAELKVFDEIKRRVKESTFKKDLQRNIQAHGSPGAFWESEQESLLFVIEMKTRCVQEQGNKLLQMEDLVEKNLSLEDQVIHLLQQNEDLRIRVDNYQSLIQQLSKKQQEQQGELERQSHLSQRLSQDKEELMFKLKHRDSCPSIHLSAVVAELAPR